MAKGATLAIRGELVRCWGHSSEFGRCPSLGRSRSNLDEFGQVEGEVGRFGANMANLGVAISDDAKTHLFPVPHPEAR